MNQQINLTVVLKLTVNSKVAGREPGIACQQGVNCLLIEADNSVFSRCITAKPHIVDRVKAGLAEVTLNGFSINLIFYSADLNMSIAVVGVCHYMYIGITARHMTGLRIASCFLNELPAIVIAIDLDTQELESVKVENTYIIFTPIGGSEKITAIAAQVAIFLTQSDMKSSCL